MKLDSVANAIAYVVVVFAISLSRIPECEAGGFTIDLIHRDTLPSPFDSLPTDSSERVTNALRRSFSRLNTLKKQYSTQSATTEVVASNGEYLMKISFGTPPVETFAIVDTGSDLTWIQCKPCNECFDQKAPFFDPNRSSSYKPIPCPSDECGELPRTSCNGSGGTCSYTIDYGDSSHSDGDLAKETITLGSRDSQNVSFSNVIMGCGHSNRGTFSDATTGIVGLGGGKVSLITQMGSSIQGKFSYCLSPLTSKTSKMNFGDGSLVTGAGAVSTPIVQKSPNTFYFLTLEGVSVGNERVEFGDSLAFSSSSSDGSKAVVQGNIIIDSGTTLTFLPTEFYNKVVAAVKRQINAREIADPLRILNLCYFLSDVKQVPEITVHFRGADVQLKPINTFVQTTQNSLCLAFEPASNFGIYGNLAQINFLVGYDLEKRTVSFKPTDCSK